MINIDDARLTVYQPLINNISLRDIEHASQLNNTISFMNRLRDQLNDAERKKQSLDLTAKLAQISESFAKAPDNVKAELLQDVDLKLNVLNKALISTPQDSPEFKGRKTYGKGGSRKLTAAELAEKDLINNDRQAKESVNLQIIDLTSSEETLSQLPSLNISNSSTSTISDTIIVALISVGDGEIVVLNT